MSYGGLNGTGGTRPIGGRIGNDAWPVDYLHGSAATIIIDEGPGYRQSRVESDGARQGFSAGDREAGLIAWLIRLVWQPREDPRWIMVRDEADAVIALCGRGK